MYDLSKEFKNFYENKVVLPAAEKTKLRDKKKLNIDRLESGLDEYNEEKNEADDTLEENFDENEADSEDDSEE